MAVVYETVENWGLKKCGEISTLLSVGKNEFFLSCEFCDYTAIQLDKFIRHMCKCHLSEFTKEKSREKPPEPSIELQQEDACNQRENSIEDSVDKDYALKGFERVEIELETMDVGDDLVLKEENISDEFVSENEDVDYETVDNTSYYERKSMPIVKSGECGKKKRYNGPSDEEKKFIIDFIGLYRSLPLLWDPKHSNYNNRKSRDKQYDILLAKYKEKFPKAVRKDVRKKVNSLRSNYRRELKRITPHGTPALYYFDAMDFLRNNDKDCESYAANDELENDEENKSNFEFDETDDKMEVFDTTTKSDSFDIAEDTFQDIHIYDEENTNVQEEEENFETHADEKKFTFEFIELYHSLPALWNVKSKDYKDRELKDIQYQILLSKYKERYPNADGQDLRKRISTLRSSFRRQLKRPYPPNLYYFNAMRFLLDIDESLNVPSDYEDNSRASFKTEDDAGPTEEIFKYETEIEMDDEDESYIGDSEEKISKRKFIIELIKLYQTFPPLWDINNKDYHNRALKNKQYDILLEKFRQMYPDADRDDIKKRINSLRSNFRRELKRGTTNLFYYDAMSFLLSNYEVKPEDPSAKKFAGAASLLSDAQFVDLAKLYERYTCLWDETDIAFRFANRRREAVDALLEEFNDISEVKLTKNELEKEILILRKIVSIEKKQKIECKRKKIAYEPTCPYYDDISYLEVDVAPFECSVCGELLKGSMKHKIHVASHDGSFPFKCIVCGHGVKEPRNFSIHLRRHVQDFAYTCTVCNRSVATKSELTVHMRTHTGERPYVCDICGKRFILNAKFKNHMDTHAERPLYKCEICSKPFFNKDKRREHRAIHSRERNKVCNVCNKAFKTGKQLRQHKFIHDEEKKFVCRFCGKRFAQPAGLSGHIKSHGTSISEIGADLE